MPWLNKFSWKLFSCISGSVDVDRAVNKNEFLDMGTEIFVRIKWEIKVKSERLEKMGARIMY